MKHLIRTQTSKGFGLPAGRARHAGRHPCRQRPAVHAAAQVAQDRDRRPERREHLRDSARRQARRLPGRAAKRQGRQRRRRRRHAQLRHRPVPRRGVPPAGARRPHRAERQEAAGGRDLAADRRADQLRGRRRRGQPAGARVGAGARQEPLASPTSTPSVSRRPARRARPRRRGRSRRPRRTARDRRQAAAHARQGRRRQAHHREDPAGQGRAARAAARSHLLRPQRRSADPAQHADAVARGRDRRHQDRGLGLDQPEAQVPGAGARPRRQAAGRRDAQRARRRAHHHHQPQAHGGRLLHLRQQDRRQGDRHRLQRQERCARPAAVRGRAEGSRPGRTDRERHRQGRPRQPRRELGLRHAAGRALVRRRGPRPHRRAAREEELPARRSRQVPGAQPLPLRDRAGVGGARRRDRDARGAAQRPGPDGEPAGQARVGPERLRQRARAARAAARGAVVQLLHLGLQGAARMVDRLLVRGQGIRRADRAGRPQQAGLPARPGRDPRRHAGAPHRRQGDERQAQLPGARQGAGHHHRPSCPTASPPPAPKWRWPRSTRRCWS